MIYQMKVGLKGMSPPVWRRFQVDGNMSFVDFHHVLQVAFDWEDSHLHSFMMLRSGGEKTKVEIGPVEDRENMVFPFFSFHDFYEEQEERICDWFMAEKDRAIYTYDFGADWEHEIVLEKILKPEPDVHYPYCLKAMKLAPEEDSWAMNVSIQEKDWRELTEEINLKLKTLEIGLLDSANPDDEFDWLELLEEAKSFNKLKPWELLEDDQLFIVADWESRQFLYCSVLGAGGEEYGLAVYVGNTGLQALKSTLSGESTRDIFLKQHNLLLSFVDRDELDAADYDLLKQHGMSFRGRKQWVQMRSLVPGYYPWHVDEDEGRMLLVAIEQAKEMLKEVERGLTIPSYSGGNTFFGRMVQETEEGYEWQSVHIQLKEEKLKQDDKPSLHISELDMKRVEKMQVLHTSIIFDFVMIDKPIQDSPFERPYFPPLIIALDVEHGLVLYQEVLKSLNAKEEIQKSFLKLTEQLGGIPKAMTVKKDTAISLAPVTDQLPITMNTVEKIHAIDELRDAMSRMPW